MLGSNISESVDFRVSYTGRYNVSKSTSHVRTLDNTYFSQTARAEATFVAWKRLVVRANADYNYYKGITDTFLEERLICNALLGVKLFRNRLGEVSVGVNDLLDQNGTTFRRTVTGTTLRNVTNLGVGQQRHRTLLHGAVHLQPAPLPPPEQRRNGRPARQIIHSQEAAPRCPNPLFCGRIVRLKQKLLSCIA